MPVISPHAFASPVANDRGSAVSPTLREQVRRLERAYGKDRIKTEYERLVHDEGRAR